MKNNVYQQAMLEIKKQQDLKYLAFNKKLVQTKYEMIGVRIPILTKIAKEIVKVSPYSYLEQVKYQTHEEILLNGLVIASIKEEEDVYPYFIEYLNHIDNWATCDTFCSHYHMIKKHRPLYLTRIEKMLRDDNPYIVRVGIVLLLNYYVNDEYINQVASLLKTIESSHYYVKMALAWLMCEIYIHYPKHDIFKKKFLDQEVKNLMIRKILDSNRISQEEKQKIRTTKNLG